MNLPALHPETLRLVAFLGLLGLFAQLQLLPDALHMQRLQDDLHISLRLSGLSLHRAGVLAQKLRSLVCVWEVTWQHLDHSLVTEVA